MKKTLAVGNGTYLNWALIVLGIGGAIHLMSVPFALIYRNDALEEIARLSQPQHAEAIQSLEIAAILFMISAIGALLIVLGTIPAVLLVLRCHQTKISVYEDGVNGKGQTGPLGKLFLSPQDFSTSFDDVVGVAVQNNRIVLCTQHASYTCYMKNGNEVSNAIIDAKKTTA